MKKLIQNQVLRYIFFGGCTTMVNLVCYYLLRTFTPLGITIANTIAVLLSITFAYVVNKLFVFEHKSASLQELVLEAGKFFGMRFGTMVIEVGGVDLFHFFGMNDMVAKFILQFIIIVLNYIFSKFFVFRSKKDGTTEV